MDRFEPFLPLPASSGGEERLEPHRNLRSSLRVVYSRLRPEI